ncbi:hypothetical protein SLEP1_g18881 [Rubroshorea leprosula]|uniref:Uncharacterized protein n=1 Tax=Rubroshorea leprosula TaxID=152421 RepID=A0AAV5JAT7_9ROSI|nr:hypothetical protein SLEP1_g18881 [Rubroshorea leprosula]
MSVPSGGNKKGMPRKESWDDDEDSEVEIANISSEDKDLRKDSKGGVGVGRKRIIFFLGQIWLRWPAAFFVRHMWLEKDFVGCIAYMLWVAYVCLQFSGCHLKERGKREGIGQMW